MAEIGGERSMSNVRCSIDHSSYADEEVWMRQAHGDCWRRSGQAVPVLHGQPLRMICLTVACDCLCLGNLGLDSQTLFYRSP
jgi:hypothetical protein